ncbi:2-amino-4-hydroxy-6-hydroxymethyldihydropteridine diphosphokinase [Fuscibacter oryzae]|uniref:2-amino-4-hydroxy-6-hydroxymethyldihydropteridine pyrophosphokinase n=1 Tax=Fuscibacter oryzae TaxID=2803939 RepID=A0A8J7MMS5_9RHOB|nr:2-amino-4-hydroxy-6-hydroxymethyldihydropteridine diphosphokinase [Fuscibacter oryzae]MBL4927072.1 2-amino-4-hydroxy-6-hydroxymethyldihydropteridine diphosphokinase [Fuscibacter oryzae]
MEKTALIALGGNLPWNGQLPRQTIIEAVEAVLQAFGGPIVTSKLYRTPAFPAGSGPDYVNAATLVTLRHNARAEEVLVILHEIESRFGRERLQRWGMRSLDLDLLAMGDLVQPDLATWQHWHDLPPAEQIRNTPPGLILPHPRLQDRAFVLVPLADVAPDWRHPVLGLTVLQMRDALPKVELDQVVALDSDGMS